MLLEFLYGFACVAACLLLVMGLVLLCKNVFSYE